MGRSLPFALRKVTKRWAHALAYRPNLVISLRAGVGTSVAEAVLPEVHRPLREKIKKEFRDPCLREFISRLVKVDSLCCS